MQNPPVSRRLILATLSLLLSSVVPAHAAETVQLVTTEYPPYMGQGLPRGGVIVEIAVEAFKRAGYASNVTFLPWARALNDGKEGRADGMVGIWHNAEREQWFAFSNQLPSNQIGFYKRSNSPISYKALADLKSYSIGIVRGYANPKAFEDAKLRVSEVVDDEANVRKLAGEHLDLVLIDKGVGQYLINTKVPEAKGKLVWMEPAIEKLPMHVAFPKKAAGFDKKLAAFNQGLQSMEKDGTLAKMVAEAGI